MLADLIGFVAAFFLMLPAGKDNWYRFAEMRQRRKAERSTWPGFRRIAAEVWKQKREGYSAWDSLFISLGGIGLMLAFALKLAGV
jgi:hypothetical protein